MHALKWRLLGTGNQLVDVHAAVRSGVVIMGAQRRALTAAVLITSTGNHFYSFYRDTHWYLSGTPDRNIPGSSHKSNKFAWEFRNLTLPELVDVNVKVCVPIAVGLELSR